MKKPLPLLALASALALTTLSGCASNATAEPPAPAEPLPSLAAELPATIAERGKLTVGVACDSPPAGSIDLEGNNVGYEIDIVHRIAEFAFGDPDAVEMQCVNGDNRIPFLDSGKIDLLLATFAWTEERAAAIDYSKPTWISNLRLVVPEDSSIEDYDDLAGKTVITPSGSAYVPWFEKCHPDVTLSLVPSVVDGTTALGQGRGDAFAYLDIYDYNFVQQNPGYKVVGSLEARGIQGIGVKKGNEELLTWINEVVDNLRADDAMFEAFSAAVDDPDFIAPYRDIVPGPDVEVEYTSAGIQNCSA